jgi:AGCS family alanine or glycine:cation symporter
MRTVMSWLKPFDDILWHEIVLWTVLGVGVLFTIWTRFGQWTALSHGISVIRGKYDDKRDPGAINHFQALSTALSATVGLGNIAGVAVAISLGGPGAVFWMWMVGLVGMALKMTEVTQAMLFRNTDDPDNPHGGAMWVCKQGFARISPALAPFGTLVGGIFCITLLISAVTGGNMFQAWNVADISYTYLGINQYASGVFLTLAVGMVIVGGIKRIGDVAGRVVPFMCLLYVLAGLYVIVTEYDRIPAMFALIFSEAFSPTEGVGAFLGGTAGYALLKGMQRALFSSEAGQGSAPIAHSAAKTNEPAREGVVAGLEPFVDTIIVCTITAMVILLTSTWNRDPGLVYDGVPQAIVAAVDADGAQMRSGDGGYRWHLPDGIVAVRDEIEGRDSMRSGMNVFVVIADSNSETGGERRRIDGELRLIAERWLATFDSRSDAEKAAGVPAYSFTTDLPEPPALAVEGVYFGYKGATLTAKAFDRALPGLGFWIVPAAVWLFAFSTIISWSYYGEQGVIFLVGPRGVMPYRVIYCMLVLVAASPLIRTENELDVISTVGTGVMLWANIPIMLIFGPIAMRAYHDYVRRLRAGEMKGHDYPKLSDVVEGKDVE